jgi:hypothetical protein
MHSQLLGQQQQQGGSNLQPAAAINSSSSGHKIEGVESAAHWANSAACQAVQNIDINLHSSVIK